MFLWENLYNVNGIVTKACVDLLIVDIPNEMLVHGINEGRTIPSWMQLMADERWETMFNFWESILLDNGCTLVMCSARECERHIFDFEAYKTNGITGCFFSKFEC
jgi:hypothetical protein